MSDYSAKAENTMPRDELRNILYEWLREKGILGELQAFIQQKMVEKLNFKGLITKHENSPSNINEEMLRLFVVDYLQHRKLFYTMSVLKVESLGSNFSNQSLKTFRRCVAKDLEFNDPIRNLLMSASESTVLLEDLLEALRLRTRSEEMNEKGDLVGGISAPRLGINVQTQTSLILDTDQSESERNLNLPTKQINKKELMPLKPLQDGAYPYACQSETSVLHTSEEHASRAMRLRILSKSTSVEQYYEDEAGNIVNDTLLHEKKIEKAQRFLDVLDSRLLNINRRYQKAANLEIL